MKMLGERRDFFRLGVEIPVTILMQTQTDSTEHMFFSGVIRDLSGGGVRIDTNVLIERQKKLQLRFTLPVNDLDNPSQDFFINARIVRLQKKNQKKCSTYGVQFVDILPGIQDRIVKFLFDLQIASRYHVRESESKEQKDNQHHVTREIGSFHT